MHKKNIVLTGFMGTGKSTLGHLLARRLNYKFIDTDSEIEKRSGKTITDIFREDGEAAFRRQEKELVEELAQKRGLVISTGGGLVMNPQNVQKLRESGDIICLTASPDEILERVSKQPQTRPLLKETDPREKIAELLQQRSSIYAQFRQLPTSGQSPDELTARLIEMIQPV